MVFVKGQLAGLRALVVDDEDDIREALAEFLELCGMEVDTAASGAEGFATFRKRRPAIVISDVWMPNGSGCDLVQRIRGLPLEEGGLTPAIAISGAASVEECLMAGFQFHFTKPVDPLVLLDTIRDFVATSSAGRAKWSVVAQGASDLVVRFDGHVTAADMRAAVSVLSEVLAGAKQGYRVVVDLRTLSGFDPSVGAVAQTVAWSVRHKIRSALIVGGPWMAHLVARGACLILGVQCEIVAAASAAVDGPVSA